MKIKIILAITIIGLLIATMFNSDFMPLRREI